MTSGMKDLARNTWTQHTVTPSATKSTITLRFEPALPDDIPGVYRLERVSDGKVYYVGETSNLKKRLTFLFRSNSPKNPHPFHSHYQKAVGHTLSCKEMCRIFRVAIFNTQGLRGRVEIEQEEIRRHQTNKKKFYCPPSV